MGGVTSLCSRGSERNSLDGGEQASAQLDWQAVEGEAGEEQNSDPQECLDGNPDPKTLESSPPGK